jgi:hypothetical protein
MTSPTQRTLAALRKAGWLAEVVERWNQYAGIRQDLFGVFDIIAVQDKPTSSMVVIPCSTWGILAVQCTSASNHSARVKKIIESPKAFSWMLAGGRIQVWSWRKAGERGKAKRWTSRVEDISESMFPFPKPEPIHCVVSQEMKELYEKCVEGKL